MMRDDESPANFKAENGVARVVLIGIFVILVLYEAVAVGMGFLPTKGPGSYGEKPRFLVFLGLPIAIGIGIFATDRTKVAKGVFNGLGVFVGSVVLGAFVLALWIFIQIGLSYL